MERLHKALDAYINKNQLTSSQIIGYMNLAKECEYQFERMKTLAEHLRYKCLVKCIFLNNIDLDIVFIEGNSIIIDGFGKWEFKSEFFAQDALYMIAYFNRHKREFNYLHFYRFGGVYSDKELLYMLCKDIVKEETVNKKQYEKLVEKVEFKEDITKITYSKFLPNVFVAKSYKRLKKGSTVELETKYGKINECIVYNLVKFENGFFYYSIINKDDPFGKERLNKKIDALNKQEKKAQKDALAYLNVDEHIRWHLRMAEPLKIGHHSAKRHQRMRDEFQRAANKSIKAFKKSEYLNERMKLLESKLDIINLSSPLSIAFYKKAAQEATSLNIKSKVNKQKQNYNNALLLWGNMAKAMNFWNKLK